MTDIVRIKPLEWESLKPGLWRAITPVGVYFLRDYGIGSVWWEFYPHGNVESDTLDAAKAAAEADFRKRIAPAFTSPWQPMESAPKDGRQILIKSTNYGEAVVSYRNCGDWADVDGFCLYRPVAWMEIPPLEQPK